MASTGVLRLMRSVLYRVGVFDAPTIVAVAVILAAVTLIATTAPLCESHALILRRHCASIERGRAFIVNNVSSYPA